MMSSKEMLGYLTLSALLVVFPEEFAVRCVNKVGISLMAFVPQSPGTIHQTRPLALI